MPTKPLPAVFVAVPYRRMISYIEVRLCYGTARSRMLTVKCTAVAVYGTGGIPMQEGRARMREEGFFLDYLGAPDVWGKRKPFGPICTLSSLHFVICTFHAAATFDRGTLFAGNSFCVIFSSHTSKHLSNTSELCQVTSLSQLIFTSTNAVSSYYLF